MTQSVSRGNRRKTWGRLASTALGAAAMVGATMVGTPSASAATETSAATRPAGNPAGSPGAGPMSYLYYDVIARHSGRCLDVNIAGPGSGLENGANVQQWACHGGNNQQWRLVSTPGFPGWYRIVSARSGKCLDVNIAGPGSGRQNGANVQQWTCHNGPNQRWRPVNIPGTGHYRLVSAHSWRCLDVNIAGPGSGQQNGANVQQWACHNGWNQQWRLN